MFVYNCYDKIAKTVRATFIAQNDSDAVRNNFPGLSRLLPPVDMEIYRVANIPSESFRLEMITPEKLDIENLYRFPETMIKDGQGRVLTKEEALSLMGFDPNKADKIKLQNPTD